MESSKIYHGGGKPKTRFSSAGIDTDRLVAITGADTTPKVLDSKIAVGANIGKQTLNPGGDEQLQIFAFDRNVKVTMNDTTQNYLSSKLTAGTGIQTTLLNPGGNEQYQISATGKPLITMAFATVGVFSVGTDIPAPVNGAWPGGVQGYGIGANATKLTAIWACINRFKSTDGVSTIDFELRRLTADGTRTVPYPGTGGTVVRVLQMSFPNTAGAFRYYLAGAANGLSDSVDAGQMVFCRCSAKSVDLVEGVTILAFWELQ